MSIKKLLGIRIKELRVKSGYTQAELAEIVNIDPKHQSCVENGRNYPSADLIEKYAEAFNIDPTEVLKITHMKPRRQLEKELFQIIRSASDKECNDIYKIITCLKA